MSQHAPIRTVFPVKKRGRIEVQLFPGGEWMEMEFRSVMADGSIEVWDDYDEYGPLHIQRAYVRLIGGHKQDIAA